MQVTHSLQNAVKMGEDGHGTMCHLLKGLRTTASITAFQISKNGASLKICNGQLNER